MDRKPNENANDRGKNNINNDVIRNEENMKPPTSLGKNTGLVSVTADVETVISVDNGPKNIHAGSNLDDVNLMTSTHIGTVNATRDDADSRKRIKKPLNYAAKKTVAQGMMDIALITSNANQLKNLIDYQRPSATFYLILIMIILSLLLQLSVGVSLIFMGRFDSKGKDKAAAARVNKWVMSAVFTITVINVFIAVFSTGPPAPFPPIGPTAPSQTLQ